MFLLSKQRKKKKRERRNVRTTNSKGIVLCERKIAIGVMTHICFLKCFDPIRFYTYQGLRYCEEQRRKGIRKLVSQA